MQSMTKFYVTRRDGSGFVGVLTLDEIQTQVAAGRLNESFYATESDDRSFHQFKRSGAGRWRTIAVLLAEWRTIAALLAESPGEAEALLHENVHRSARLSDHFEGGSVSVFLLGVGMLTAVLSCLSIPIVLIAKFAVFPSGLAWVAVLLAGCSFCMSAAMAVVYKRALSVEKIAVDQDFENQRLWEAIEQLRGEDGSPATSSERGHNK